MNNGMRAMQRASDGGNVWGTKPVNKRAAVTQPRDTDRTSPATYAYERNLCLKRRNWCGVKSGCHTPDPKGERRWACHVSSLVGVVPNIARRRGGRYGLLSALALELGNPYTAMPTSVGCENASMRAGGRRRRSSQMPGCNGPDRVKARQARCTGTT